MDRLTEYEKGLAVVLATEPDEYWEDNGLPAVVALTDIWGEPVTVWIWKAGEGSFAAGSWACDRYGAEGRVSASRTHCLFDSPDDIIDYLLIAAYAQR